MKLIRGCFIGFWGLVLFFLLPIGAFALTWDQDTTTVNYFNYYTCVPQYNQTYLRYDYKCSYHSHVATTQFCISGYGPGSVHFFALSQYEGLVYNGGSCAQHSDGSCHLSSAGQFITCVGNQNVSCISNSGCNSGCCQNSVCVPYDGNCSSPPPSPCYNTDACTQKGGTCGSPNRLGTPYTGLCPGDSSCVCVVPCKTLQTPPACRTTSLTLPDGDCTSTTYAANAPAAQTPPACHTTSLTLPDGDCTSTTYAANAPAARTCPVCRTTASLVSNGSCGTTTCVVNCATNCVGTICDSPPTFSTFEIRNINNTVVGAESGNNHICQSAFTGTASKTTARFAATFTDLQGGVDINNIQIIIGSQTFNPTSLTRSGNNATAIFDIATAQISPTNLQSISVSASDVNVYTGSVVSVDTNRDFKYWNCNVSITGTAYDGSLTDSSCSDSSFSSNVTFPYTLSMINVSGGASQNMVITSPNYSGSLVWGQSYIFNPTIGGNNFKLRFNNNTATCTNSLQFIVDNSKADPYSNSVQLDADFTSVLNQDPWWQAINGGAVSNTSISNRVPVTCTTCKMSPSGLVSAPGISNTGRTPLSNAQTWYYQSATAKLAVNNTNYSYFLSQYHDKNSVGTVLSGDQTVAKIADFGSDANNIFFVNGNLTIDGNIIKTGNFLMIIVSGNINITSNTTRVDGILVASNISATGDNLLTFNGSLYASGTIDFSGRDLGGSSNNLNPAVVVNYNPQMIFNLPGSLAKVLTNWQWGN